MELFHFGRPADSVVENKRPVQYFAGETTATGAFVLAVEGAVGRPGDLE